MGRNRDRDHGYAPQGKTGVGIHRIERTRPAMRTARKIRRYSILRKYASMYFVYEDGRWK